MKEGDGGILVVAENRKAFHDYQISERFEAGLSLLGSEVKSIRNGGLNLKDCYVREFSGSLFLVGCHVTPYKFAQMDAVSPTRDRRLLLNRREIDQIIGAISQKGLTVVPLKVYFRRGRCKLEIGLGKGKKLYDKREDLKKKEAHREMEREVARKRFK